MPTLEAEGTTVEVTDNGYLVNSNEWTKAIGQKVADLDELEMTEEHWDVIDYLRAEHAENPGSEANERAITARHPRWRGSMAACSRLDPSP